MPMLVHQYPVIYMAKFSGSPLPTTDPSSPSPSPSFSSLYFR